ncbi:MAG: peptide deformylase [Alphaproteobacteria bacterium]
MAILPLVIAPDERLNRKSATVEKVDDGIRRILDDMLETMYANDGIGLAAVQVGVHKRLIVIDVARREGRNEPIKLVNPEIVTAAEQLSAFTEGWPLLPRPVLRGRAARIRHRALSRRERAAEGAQRDRLLATCLQHEIDHTNGVVFVDHISGLKRDMILRRLRKAKKLGLLDELPDRVPVLRDDHETL